jgi:ABC-type lipoprotein release transport system permease subunit
MSKGVSLPLLLTLFIFSSAFLQSSVLSAVQITIKGTVKEPRTGNPLPHATILVCKSIYMSSGRETKVGWVKVAQGETDSNGYFILNPLTEPTGYTIYAYYDDPSTPGFDYVPARKSIQAPSSGSFEMAFELWEGASMILDGEPLFVETTESPSSSYSVSEPDSGELMQFGEYPLSYGEGVSPTPNLNYFLGLNQSYLVVPANLSFMVKVDSQIKVEGKSLTRSFLIDQPNHFSLNKGEVIHADVREFCLPMSLSTVRTASADVEAMIEDEEKGGFYLAVERQRFAQITSLTLEAENYLNQGTYETSFTRLREAYVEISNLRNWLSSMYGEALISVFFIILFLAFTATTTSFLLFEENSYKIMGSLAFYAVFLLAFYLLYPGSQLVEASLFLGTSLASLVAALGVTILFPRLLKGRRVKGDVPLGNMIVPVFSIAKRSLSRRRLRFALTLFTVMALVSSFIALTSFSVGFGLTFNQVSTQPAPSIGVLIRAPNPLTRTEEEEFLFSPLDNSSIEWFTARPEVSLMAPKYENQPRNDYPEAYFPLDYVQRVPIFGIVGVVPSAEVEFLPWNGTIVEGRYLNDSDENGVLISADLKESLNTTVGASLTLRSSGIQLKIVGIFDDEKVEELRDLDGQSLLPKKIIVTGRISTPTGAILVRELEVCSADETLVVTWKTTSKIYGVGFSRLNIELKEVENLGEYAKMMALNKGFRAWASTGGGVYLAELASYFEGKGLPLAVPWGIVVLNVVVTMLNSFYERRREVFVYSAIGMNPSHISGLFLTEAAMIGVIGGGIGYLLGLGWYKFMAFLTLALQVRQKVSAIWCIAAIAISLTAVLVGGFLALRWSVVITPSLRRRWHLEEEPLASQQVELILPVRVSEAELDEFAKSMVKKLRSHMNDMNFVTSQIRDSAERKEKKETEKLLRAIEFTYRSTAKPFGSYSKNKFILKKEEGSRDYTVKLLTSGDQEGMHKAGYFVRKLIMEWGIERGKMEERK